MAHKLPPRLYMSFIVSPPGADENRKAINRVADDAVAAIAAPIAPRPESDIGALIMAPNVPRGRVMARPPFGQKKKKKSSRQNARGAYTTNRRAPQTPPRVGVPVQACGARSFPSHGAAAAAARRRQSEITITSA